VIEIVCPSCQARYELPDNSIGEQGRKVSCSSCQHKWRAYPEGMEPAETDELAEAPQLAELPGTAEPSRPEPEPAMEPHAAASMPSGAAAAGAAAAAAQAPAATGSRDDQLATIRQMLSDLKASADSGPEAETEEEPEPANPVSATARGFYRDSEAEERQDPLKARINQVDTLGRAVKGEPAQNNYDAAQLRKRHEKRAKRMQRARERQRKSGGFMTGFTLIAMVASVVVGLYVLQPRIVASQPQLEPVMNQYVTTIDRYRIELGEQTEVWKSWITEKIEKVSNDEQLKP
jgi:predicted Zn finger-like uncharacterized protein